MRIFGLQQDSIVDGPGFRFACFVQGCPHVCPGCHNPDSHDPAGGQEMSVEEVARQLGTQVFRFKVHRSVGVAMAPAHGQTVLTYQPKSKSAQDLQALVDVVGGERFPGPKKSGLSFWS